MEQLRSVQGPQLRTFHRRLDLYDLLAYGASLLFAETLWKIGFPLLKQRSGLLEVWEDPLSRRAVIV
jgi:hypothetical protein